MFLPTRNIKQPISPLQLYVNIQSIVNTLTIFLEVFGALFLQKVSTLIALFMINHKSFLWRGLIEKAQLAKDIDTDLKSRP
jgi:hypothetical protein